MRNCGGVMPPLDCVFLKRRVGFRAKKLGLILTKLYAQNAHK